jgi:hypothetical protein
MRPKLLSRSALVGFGLLLLPLTANAQVAAQDRVTRSIGKQVTVTAKDGQRYRGALRALSATEVTVADAAGDRAFPLSGVRNVVVNSQSIAKGAVIGLASATGFVLAACMSGQCSGDEASLGSSAFAGIALFAGIGAGAGAGIGALLRPSTSSRTLFSTTQTTEIVIVPVIGNGRMALATSVRW